jgi:hypothetical protein
MNIVIHRLRVPHYYGDIVRALFLVAAVVMVVGLPAVSNSLNIPTAFSVAGMLVLGLAAGFTNPKQKWDAAVNVGIAAVGFFVFESYAVSSYQAHVVDKFFMSNLVLGFLFLMALYYGVKTLRGLVIKI